MKYCIYSSVIECSYFTSTILYKLIYLVLNKNIMNLQLQRQIKAFVIDLFDKSVFLFNDESIYFHMLIYILVYII